MALIRRLMRARLRRFGCDVHTFGVPGLTLIDLEFDLPRLVHRRSPLIVDIGANKGQTIDLIRTTLPDSKIIAFEPDPILANALRAKYTTEKVTVEAFGLGSESGQAMF